MGAEDVIAVCGGLPAVLSAAGLPAIHLSVSPDGQAVVYNFRDYVGVVRQLDNDRQRGWKVLHTASRIPEPTLAALRCV